MIIALCHLLAARNCSVIASAHRPESAATHLYGITNGGNFVDWGGSMKAKLATSLALVAGLLAVCGSAFAHHGSVAYDNKKLVIVKDATVTKVSWANPHVLVQFDGKDESGVMQHWVVETGSPSLDTSQGWTNTTVQPGDTITFYLYQAKTGRPVGRLSKMVLADGKTFGNGGELGADRIANCSDESINGGNEAAACRPDGKKTANGQK
jgi:hypothetical protein